MEIVINYGLYFIAIFCVLTPAIAFGLFAPVIAGTTVVGFVINWIAQFLQRIKEGISQGNFFEKLFETSHSEEENPMWIDNAKPEKDSHPAVPISTYFGVFAGLLLLTGINVWISTLELGSLKKILIMGIATVQAVLALLFFMHLKYDNMLNRTIFLSSFFFLLLLFALSMGDIATRIPPVMGF